MVGLEVGETREPCRREWLELDKAVAKAKHDESKSLLSARKNGSTKR